MDFKAVVDQSEVLQRVSAQEEILWLNPNYRDVTDFNIQGLTKEAIDEAETRLLRFAPYLREVFPETEKTGGLIESPLVAIPQMKASLNQALLQTVQGELYLKMDSELPIAGSVKARGGIYEILKHTEDLAIANNILIPGESYARLADPTIKQFFGNYAIHVGSTGNLGLSIGIMSAKVGYRVTVHMSADARQWKKDLLRSHGATVIEYAGDYGKAVAQGRLLSDLDPKSYFVDDENSRTLFLGYAVAAKRLYWQLEAQEVKVDEAHPLFVYIPCGVGGAPGGITYGLKTIFGNHVHCFFIEPTQAPCMLVGMESGLNEKISVQDIGLTGLTEADGLAVGRPSGFVGAVMGELLSGIFTIKDYKLFDYLRELKTSEDRFIEPSACASFEGPVGLFNHSEGIAYLKKHDLFAKMDQSTHIAWATGGRLVPQDIQDSYLKTHLNS